MSELFPSPAPDFSDPLGLLRACHERILNHCATLLRLADHIAAKGADAEARQAAAAVHRYFTTAGRHHHQDEERDIFPRLARQSLKLADIVHRLRQDHPRLEAAWAAIEPNVLRLDTITDVTDFRAKAQQLAELYRAHIDSENSELLDVAQHIFSRKDLQQIGAAMAERRGIRPTF